MEALFERFITERIYLKNITPQTQSSYKNAKKALFRLHGQPFGLEELSKAKLTSWVIQMRQNGLSVGGCNVYIRTVNAFLHWLVLEGHYPERIKLPLQKEEQKLITTLSVADMRRIVDWKSTGTGSANLRRAHLLALTILDTGLRASEVLSLTKKQVDFDNLIIKTIGKGGKHRLVPFSPELRKSLWRYSQRLTGTFMFGTKNNTKVSIRNFERDLDVLGKQIGLVLRPHNLRHCFSVNYLKRGGNLEYLRRILGHSSISTTQKYLRGLGIDDLQAVHSQFSVLSGR